jgi:HKD family nuclease
MGRAERSEKSLTPAHYIVHVPPISLSHSFVGSDPLPELRSLFPTHVRSFRIVTGFLTKPGLTLLKRLASDETKIDRLIIGRATPGAWEGVTSLSPSLVERSVRVHLGWKIKGKPLKVQKGWRPMLHSKIYLITLQNGTSWAYVGSNNCTEYALRGKNGEAGFVIQGPSDAEVFHQMERYIESLWSHAVPFRQEHVEYYSAALDSVVRAELSESNGNFEQVGVILLENRKDSLPAFGDNDRIYFEIPKSRSSDWTHFQSLGKRVHLAFAPRGSMALKEPGDLPVVVYEATVAGTYEGTKRSVTTYRVSWRIPDIIAPTVEPAMGTIRGSTDALRIVVRIRRRIEDAELRTYYLGPRTKSALFLMSTGETSAEASFADLDDDCATPPLSESEEVEWEPATGVLRKEAETRFDLRRRESVGFALRQWQGEVEDKQAFFFIPCRHKRSND